MSAPTTGNVSSPAKKMTLNEAYKILDSTGVPDALHDARVLFRRFAGARDIDLIDRSFSSDSEELREAIARRADREPLQYIIGEVDFYRESYLVDPSVLIPRQDTEILVDFAVKNIPEGKRFADLCCGSGCVGLSTLSNTKNTTAILADISDGALAVARKNAERIGVKERADFVLSDVLKERVAEEVFAVLSNPPYVSEEAYAGLEPEIYREPRIAFVGRESGIEFYRKLTPMYKDVIAKDGFIAYEIGYDQADALAIIAEDNGMSSEILTDLSDNARVAVLRHKIH